MVIPKELDPIHTGTSAALFEVRSPLPNSVFNKNSRVDVIVDQIGANQLSRVEYMLNGRLIGSRSAPPFNLSFEMANNPDVEDGINTITVIGRDSLLNKITKDIPILVN